jgi:hypothetical protein
VGDPGVDDDNVGGDDDDNTATPAYTFTGCKGLKLNVVHLVV